MTNEAIPYCRIINTLVRSDEQVLIELNRSKIHVLSSVDLSCSGVIDVTFGKLFPSYFGSGKDPGDFLPPFDQIAHSIAYYFYPGD